MGRRASDRAHQAAWLRWPAEPAEPKLRSLQRLGNTSDSAAKSCCIRQYSARGSSRAHCRAMQQCSAIQRNTVCSNTALYNIQRSTPPLCGSHALARAMLVVWIAPAASPSPEQPTRKTKCGHLAKIGRVPLQSCAEGGGRRARADSPRELQRRGGLVAPLYRSLVCPSQCSGKGPPHARH